jgi:hypothetical protein
MTAEVTFRGGLAVCGVAVALAVAVACGGTRAAAAGALMDAGDADGNADFTDVRLPSPADFADVSVEVDFTEPVWLPDPATSIEGDVTALVGSWVQVHPDGSPCTPASSGFPSGDFSCFHLDIRKGDGGGAQGSVYVEFSWKNSPGTPSGPFAPPSDPNVGYPTTVSPSDYFSAEQLCPDVDYRLFDGVMQNGTLSFWFSPIDLWSDWCGLQTPWPWDVVGERKYRCASQTADPSTTDLGKLALCTSAQDRPMCTDSNGFVHACICLADAGPSPLCHRTVCECSASQCRADVRSVEHPATFALQGGRLVGTVSYVDYLASGVTLQRVTP